MKKLIIPMLLAFYISLSLGTAPVLATDTPKPTRPAVVQIEHHGEIVPIETPAPEPTYTPTYTDDELSMLACVIYQEAGGNACSDDTRIMVGNVVMNRIADPRFPDTMEAVLTAKGQYGRFHWTGVVWPERAEYEPDAVDRAYECARRVLEGETLLPSDVVFQSEFVLGEIVAQANEMYFCK